MGSLTEVLVLEHIRGEEGGSAVHCQNPQGGECSFHGTNSQACLTHGHRYIECSTLLHECECNSPTLIAPLPDILRYLPSVLGGTSRTSEESHARDTAMQALEATTT